MKQEIVIFKEAILLLASLLTDDVDDTNWDKTVVVIYSKSMRQYSKSNKFYNFRRVTGCATIEF